LIWYWPYKWAGKYCKLKRWNNFPYGCTYFINKKNISQGIPTFGSELSWNWSLPKAFLKKILKPSFQINFTKNFVKMISRKKSLIAPDFYVGHHRQSRLCSSILNVVLESLYKFWEKKVIRRKRRRKKNLKWFESKKIKCSLIVFFQPYIIIYYSVSNDVNDEIFEVLQRIF